RPENGVLGDSQSVNISRAVADNQLALGREEDEALPVPAAELDALALVGHQPGTTVPVSAAESTSTYSPFGKRTGRKREMCAEVPAGTRRGMMMSPVAPPLRKLMAASAPESAATWICPTERTFPVRSTSVESKRYISPSGKSLRWSYVPA